MSAKRIGFYDYRLDNYHADVYLSAIRGPLSKRGYEVCGATALVPTPSEAWCRAKEVSYFERPEDLAAQIDYFVILSPSNPEVHLEMCKRVFPLKKPTFVDKTFAPSSEIAREIFACADEHSLPIQSTSALRSTNVQKLLASEKTPLQSMIVDSSGPSFDEYGIHPFELVISCMGADVARFSRVGNDEVHQYIIVFADSRTAVVNFHQHAEVPFSTKLISAGGCREVVVTTDSLFVDAAAAILDFFDAGRPLIDRRETLMIRKLLDLADERDTQNRFVEVDERKGALSPPHWRTGPARTTSAPSKSS